jgi:hypothetical protein
MKKEFPTFAVILLVLGVLWLLTDLDILSVSIPWFPIILVIIALGMIVNKYRK